MYQIQKIYFIIVLPLFAIFGKRWLVIEFAVVLQDLIDTLGCWLVLVVFLFTVIIFRNDLFCAHVRYFYYMGPKAYLYRVYISSRTFFLRNYNRLNLIWSNFFSKK